MPTIEERTAYLHNPFFTQPIKGDFTPFYITIAICTVIGILIILLNIICACCSKYKSYWQDRHTGNRWIVSIWSATPHKQPPLDFTELKSVDEIYYQKRPIHESEASSTEHVHSQYIEPLPQQERPSRPSRFQRHQPPAEREEYLELQHKRESDI